MDVDGVRVSHDLRAHPSAELQGAASETSSGEENSTAWVSQVEPEVLPVKDSVTVPRLPPSNEYRSVKGWPFSEWSPRCSG